MDISSAMSARASVWSPIQPGDDIAVRADKLERNLDRLRDELHETRAEYDARVRELEQRLTGRINDLDQFLAKRHDESRQVATAAMRWEVRGLLLTLVGAGLSISDERPDVRIHPGGLFWPRLPGRFDAAPLRRCLLLAQATSAGRDPSHKPNDVRRTPRSARQGRPIAGVGSVSGVGAAC
jgi:hypothetical protein